MKERSERINNPENPNTKTFILVRTKKSVSFAAPTTDQYPVFGYHVRQGEIHFLDNLHFDISNICPESRTININFYDSQDGNHCLNINDLYLEGNVLRIGDMGEFTLRKIKGNGLVEFYFSLSRDVQIDQLDYDKQLRHATAS